MILESRRIIGCIESRPERVFERAAELPPSISGGDRRREPMKLYRLKFTLTEPSEGTEDKYLAEVPDLPGCRAWGDTAAQAVENLQSVAVAFMESCRDRGDGLPPQVAAAAEDVDGRRGFSEVMVAV